MAGGNIKKKKKKKKYFEIYFSDSLDILYFKKNFSMEPFINDVMRENLETKMARNLKTQIYRRLSRSRQLGWLVPVLGLGVPPRYKAR